MDQDHSAGAMDKCGCNELAKSPFYLPEFTPRNATIGQICAVAVRQDEMNFLDPSVAKRKDQRREDFRCRRIEALCSIRAQSCQDGSSP